MASKTKIITLYNHKGGVSKTTTTFNLAHLIAEKDKKVLVVDADPQCNITELLLVNKIEELDEKEAASGKEQPLPGTSILDLLRPRIEGDRSDIDVSDVDTIQITENLFLLRGDVDLSEIEEALAEAHSQRFSNKTHEKKTYVALGSFLRKFGEESGFDYILLDVGPSSGALTRACFLVCDGFYVPTLPDRFNVQAVRTLSSIIGRWMEDHAQIYDSFRKLSLPISLGRPIFLGIILQNFKLYRGAPRKGYTYWINKIPRAYGANLRPLLQRFSTIERDLTGGFDETTCICAHIPDFQSLAPLLQEAGKPVFSITQEDTKAINNGKPYAGQVWEQAEDRMATYRAQINEIYVRLSLI